MTLSYTTGLTVGSLFAYILDTRFELPIQSKDVCYKAPSLTSIPFNNTTPSSLTDVTFFTLFTLTENVTSKVNTTVTVLSNFLSTSSLMSNNTVSSLTTAMTESSTISPKISFNVTTSVNNAILQH